MTAALFTVSDLLPILQELRAGIHQDLQELRASGAAVNVTFDAVFVCELLGLVLDVATGEITGWADERVRLRAPKVLAARVPVVLDGEVDALAAEVDGE